MQPPPSLDDPDYAALAWARFRRILAWMGLFSVACALIAVGILWLTVETFAISMVIATLVGVGGSVFLAAVLMGLMFLSSGSGHDAAVDERRDD